MNIVFHGGNAACFIDGIAEAVGPEHGVTQVSDALDEPGERDVYAAAEVVVGTRFDAALPRPTGLRLLQVPAAGYDGVRFEALPSGASVCNCFGHEQPIAEYVMAALLARIVPLADADRRLRTGEWAYWAGATSRAHGELAGRTIGLLGYGHIGQAVARLARAFGMRVHVANRGRVSDADRYFALSEVEAFCAGVDAVVVSVPLVPETTGLVGAAALAAMRPDAVLVNVARGPVVDEAALFAALRDRRIGGAVIDTWYRYPALGEARTPPGTLPFETLPNVVMTPHMSGWTHGAIARRRVAIAENVGRLARGEELLNLVHVAG